MAAVIRRLPNFFCSNSIKPTEWKFAFAVNNKKKRSYFTYTNEIAQPLPREPPSVCAEEAVKVIESGKALFYSVTFIFSVIIIFTF